MLHTHIGRRVVMGAARTTGHVAAASMRTTARKVAVVLFLIISVAIGSATINSHNAQIAKEENKIHQQDAREAAQFAKAKPPPDTPNCTTSTKSGTHTVHVDSKGRVTTSRTSGTVTKTCK